MRKHAMLVGAVLGFMSFMGAQVPVPFINQPLAPSAAAPGGSDVTLTIDGTGFVTGSVVNWNGSALVTTFVDGSHLSAIVPAANTAIATTGSVTVVNPGLGGGTSNVVFLPITVPTASVNFSRTDITTGGAPSGAITGDFNGDGKLDMVVVDNSGGRVSVLLGNGDGTFQSPVDYAVGSAPSVGLAGDFNNDGKLDLAIRNEASANVSILLGRGDGTFRPAVNFATGNGYGRIVGGDFDRDGNLDLAVTNDFDDTVSILLGKGDGTFKPHVDYAVGSRPIPIAMGDLNGDGKLDLVIGHTISDTTFAVLLGNGDGTFQSYIPESTIYDIESVVLADFDGDGKLDAALFSEGAGVPGVKIMLGNGDGTFRDFATLPTSCGSNFNDCYAAAADMNGDGKIDLVVRNSPANTVQVIPGNGDGTFGHAVQFASGANPEQVVVGDFNGDGRLDLVVPNFNTNFTSVFLQGPPEPVVHLSTSSLKFGSQLHGIASPVQTLTLTNTGSAALNVTSISATANFFEKNTCGSSVAPGGKCVIHVDFLPGPIGLDRGTLTITDNAPGSPQEVGLSGVGTVMSISASSLNFGSQAVGTTSSALTVTLTNHSGVRAVPIYNARIDGGNFLSFAQTNTCGTSVAAGSSCSFSVTFTPKEKGRRASSLYIWNGGGETPETVTLSGDGT